MRGYIRKKNLTAYKIREACLRARLHGSPRLTNAVESMKLNSTVERYCLHGSTKVNEAVDSKMAANELVQEGVVVVMCVYLIKECQHILGKRNKRKKTTLVGQAVDNET